MAYYSKEDLANIRKGLEHAKANPDDPKSQEIQRRLRNGQLNFELKALGLNPVPVKQPQIDMSKIAPVNQTPAAETQSQIPKEKPSLLSSAKETLGDIKETAVGIGKQVGEGAAKIYDISTDDDFTLAQKFMGNLGAAAGTAAGVIGEATIGAGKVALTQEAEQKVGEFVKEAAQAVSETEIAQKVVPKVTEWYANLDKDDKLIVDSLGGMVAIITEMIGIKGASVAGKVVKEGAEAAVPLVKEGIETGVDVAKEAVKQTDEALSAFQATRRPAQVAAQQQKVDEAVGRILQGTSDDVAAGKRALSEIDLEGVKTYKDLNNSIKTNIQTLAKTVDEELNKFPEKYTASQSGKYETVGGKTVSTSPVIDALDGLEGAYTKSGEAAKAEAIRQLKSRFETEGLTVKEINDISREYNIEFRERAFSKMGDPKAGYNAENYENVRKGVKDVVRERIPDERVKELDAKMSDLYATSNLTKRMEEKVNALQQKITNRTLAQKVGGAAASIVDLASFGTLRGFISRMLPSNVGNKAMNSLEIEKELTKNIAQIDKLLKMKDDAAFSVAFKAWEESLKKKD